MLDFNPLVAKNQMLELLLPRGEYIAKVVGAELNNTKAGNGSYIRVTLKITQGKYFNRELTDIILYTHTNKTAELYGRDRLASLCLALDIRQLKDFTQLYNKEVIADVDIQSGNLAEENKIKNYSAKPEPLQDTPPSAWAAQQFPQQQQQAQPPQQQPPQQQQPQQPQPPQPNPSINFNPNSFNDNLPF